MSEMKRNDFMMQVLSELAPELKAAGMHPRVVKQALEDVLPNFLPLPPESAFLGVATDGLPVLLNLNDPVTGPMLITGDAGSGKTNLLQMIAKAVDGTHEASAVEYGVITGCPDEWTGLEGSENRVDIFPADSTSADAFLESLDEWAHSNHGDRQSVLLLIDDLTTILQMDAESQHSMRWLLLRGPARRVWPIVTINPKRVPEVHPWLSFFHTRLFGRIANPQDLGDLAGGSRPRLHTLAAGSEFMMREGNDWLKFWIPGVSSEAR